MDYYDLVSETCKIDDKLREHLGFKKIGVLGVDVKAAGANHSNITDLSNDIGFGKEVGQLDSLVKKGVKAISITDSYIDRKLMGSIAENTTILVLSMSIITASYGMERARNIYKMSKLLQFAQKKKIPVAFVSMAKTMQYMNSPMQLIELAKLLGADETYAKHSLSVTNKKLVMK